MFCTVFVFVQDVYIYYNFKIFTSSPFTTMKTCFSEQFYVVHCILVTFESIMKWSVLVFLQHTVHTLLTVRNFINQEDMSLFECMYAHM